MVPGHLRLRDWNPPEPRLPLFLSFRFVNCFHLFECKKCFFIIIFPPTASRMDTCFIAMFSFPHHALFGVPFCFVPACARYLGVWVVQLNVIYIDPHSISVFKPFRNIGSLERKILSVDYPRLDRYPLHGALACCPALLYLEVRHSTVRESPRDHHLQSTSPLELARNPLKGLYVSPVTFSCSICTDE